MACCSLGDHIALHGVNGLVRLRLARCVRFGAQLAAISAMPGLSGPELIAGLIFGSIGFVAFVFGKRTHVWKPMLIGIALMAYPYFVEDVELLFGIGLALTAGLFVFRS
jgi:hypothetical protein